MRKNINEWERIQPYRYASDVDADDIDRLQAIQRHKLLILFWAAGLTIILAFLTIACARYSKQQPVGPMLTSFVLISHPTLGERIADVAQEVLVAPVAIPRVMLYAANLNVPDSATFALIAGALVWGLTLTCVILSRLAFFRRLFWMMFFGLSTFSVMYMAVCTWNVIH